MTGGVKTLRLAGTPDAVIIGRRGQTDSPKAEDEYMNKRIACAVAFAAGMGAAAAEAQVNKCIDAGGNTVYSQAPCPPKSKASTVRQSVPPAPPGAAAAAKGTAPKSAAELELDFRKRQTEQADAGKKAAEKATESQQREENCRISRGTLAGLEAGGRQSRINESISC